MGPRGQSLARIGLLCVLFTIFCAMFKDWTSMRASERIYVEIFENTSKTEGKGMVLGTGGVKFLPAKSMDPREVMKKDLPDTWPFLWKCPGNPYAIPGPEDLASTRSTCLEIYEGALGFMFLNRRYPEEIVSYVENYKAGSTSIVETILRNRCPNIQLKHLRPYGMVNCVIPIRRGYQNITQEYNLTKVKAFTIVRHPVKKFISGYGTAMIHFNIAGRRIRPPYLATLCKVEEPKRFVEFVNLFVEKGLDIVNPYLKNGKLLNFWKSFEAAGFMHMFSQTWFMSLYPGPIEYIGRVESIEEDMQYLLQQHLHLNTTGEFLWKNSEESESKRNENNTIFQPPWKRSRYLTSDDPDVRGAIDKLNRYFRVELRAFGYDPL
ncbi:hypothetical protein AAMO2058_000554600 [Amorphochlora amoebiformis]